MGRSCKTCKHSRAYETGIGIAGGQTKLFCREYVRTSHSLVDGEVSELMLCEDAVSSYCHLASWKPKIWARIRHALNL